MAITKQQKVKGIAAVAVGVILVIIVCSALILWFNRVPISFTSDELSVSYFKNQASFGEFQLIETPDRDNPSEDADGVYLILGRENSLESPIEDQAVVILGKNPDVYSDVIAQVEGQICINSSYDMGMVFNQEYFYGQECNERSVYAYKNGGGQWILFTTESSNNTLEDLIAAYKDGSTQPDSFTTSLNLLAQ